MMELRAPTRPPEMMNGSTKGSVSSYSSARAMRIRGEIQEMQLAAPPLELAQRLELEHPRDQAVPRVKHERVQGPLGARAVRGGILGERELKERMELDALAAATGVVDEIGRASCRERVSI